MCRFLTFQIFVVVLAIHRLVFFGEIGVFWCCCALLFFLMIEKKIYA